MNNESRFPSNWGTVFLFSFSFISMPNTFIFQRIPTEFKVDFQYALAINNAQFIFMLVIWGGIRHLSLRKELLKAPKWPGTACASGLNFLMRKAWGNL
jgi:hypothetical protein